MMFFHIFLFLFNYTNSLCDFIPCKWITQDGYFILQDGKRITQDVFSILQDIKWIIQGCLFYLQDSIFYIFVFLDSYAEQYTKIMQYNKITNQWYFFT